MLNLDKEKFKLLWRSGGMTSLSILAVLFFLVFLIFYELIPIIRQERLDSVKKDIVNMNFTVYKLINSMSNYATICINSNLEFLQNSEVSLNKLCEKIVKSDSLIIGSSITLPYTVAGYLENSTFNEDFYFNSWDDFKTYFNTNRSANFKIGRMKMIPSYPEPVCSFTFEYPYDNHEDSVAFVTLFSSLSIQKSLQAIINPYPEGMTFLVSSDSVIVSCSIDSLIGKPAFPFIYQNYFDNADSKMLIPKSLNEVNVYVNRDWTILSGLLPIAYRSFLYILPTSVLTKDIKPLYILFFLISNFALFFILGICFLFIRKNMLINKQIEKNNLEFKTASLIQKSLLSSPIKLSSVDIGAELIPAMSIGGDLYYFFERDEYLYFCLGDVSGKGVSASLFMGLTVSLFRDKSRNNVSPCDIVEQINVSLCDNNKMCFFVTMFVGVLNLKTRVLRFCNAGHEQPLLSIGNTCDFMKTSRNLPLGVDETTSYKDESVLLDPDSVLMLYTDGVLDAKNEFKDEYGHDRFKEFFKKVCKDSSDNINKALLDDIHSFVGNNEQFDDITILTLRMK